MIFDLIGNLVLFLFFGFCFYKLEVTMPKPEPNSMPAKAWPEFILIVLMIGLAINLYQTWQKMKEDGKSFFDVPEEVKKLFHWKIWAALACCFFYVYALKYFGYFACTLVFLPAILFFLGCQSPKKLALWTVGITVVMYALFQIALKVPLPRGRWFFREFALWLESLFS